MLRLLTAAAATTLAALLLAALLLVAGCSLGDRLGDRRPAVSEPSAPSSVPGPAESDLTPGWDEQPDGPSPTPDDELDADQLTALLRVEASVTDGRGSCRPDDVTLSLRGFDAALGHRYSRIVVTNTSDSTCTVTGFAGFGGRGEWGNRLQWAAEQRELTGTSGEQVAVALEPDDEAVADLEWTGELAGADSEKASLMVVQLARGQQAVGFSAALDGEPLDLGMATTVRLGPWHRPS